LHVRPRRVAPWGVVVPAAQCNKNQCQKSIALHIYYQYINNIFFIWSE
jgi:hypothetical protein